MAALSRSMYTWFVLTLCGNLARPTLQDGVYGENPIVLQHYYDTVSKDCF